MARLSFALPDFERCERPSTASVRACRFQPGRLAQGPEEKCGTVGRVAGILAISSILPDRRPSVGRGVPRLEIRKGRSAVKIEKSARMHRLHRIGAILNQRLRLIAQISAENDDKFQSSSSSNSPM